MNRILSLIATVAICVCMSGCLAQLQAKLNLDVQAATVPDLKAAIADAQAAGDADGLACWNDVLSYVQALPTTSASAPNPTVAGVASGIEAARIAAAQAGNVVALPPIPAQLHRDCAVVVLDAEQLAAKLGISAAAIVKGGGVVKVLNAPHP
jgi:hypothetical protein